LLPACGEQAARSTPDYFIPPTLSHKATSIPLETATPTPPPSPTPTCDNDLTFINDLSVPDDTEFRPGDEIIKTWLVQNSGECNWDEEYSIRLVDGSPMGANTTQPLFPARSGSEAEITVNVTAPQNEGLTYSTWQAYDPDGEPFGQTFFIQVIINPDLEPTEEP